MALCQNLRCLLCDLYWSLEKISYNILSYYRSFNHLNYMALEAEEHVLQCEPTENPFMAVCG